MKTDKFTVWSDPYAIEHQSIINALKEASTYARGILLDVGCGTKPYRKVFLSRLTRYIGIELLSTLTYSPDIDVFASGLQLPFSEGSIDTVLSTQTIEHVPEPQKFFDECYRVLKTDGFIIIVAPQTWGLHEEPHDYYRYTRYGLQYLAEKSGFRIEYICSRRGFWAMIGQRLSSYIFHGLGAHRYMYKLSVVICAVIQIIFLSLDNINPIEKDTLGNILVARK